MGNAPGPVLDDRTKKTGLSITREIDETEGQSEQSGEPTCHGFRPGNQLPDGEVFSGRNGVPRKVHYAGEKEMSPSQGSQRPSLTARVSPGAAFGGGLISVWNAKSSISTFIVRSRASSATASKTSPMRP